MNAEHTPGSHLRWPDWLGPDFPMRLLLHIASAALLTALGVFQTDQSPLASRVVYWSGNLLLAAPIIAASEHWVARAGWAQRHGNLAGFLATTALASAAQYPVVLLFEFGVFAGPSNLFDYVDLALAEATVIAILVLAGRAVRLAFARRIVLDTGRPAAIFRRLNPKTAAGELVALKAEDHYVRIFTRSGNELVLMRFADAVAALPPQAGCQTHRSWWVADDAVQSARRIDGKPFLELEAGLQVPVSRSYLVAVRERGWI